MAAYGSHRPTNLPYVINQEGGLETEFDRVYGASIQYYLNPGGIVVLAQAQVALLLGDSVFMTSTANQVTKTNVPANYATFNGIVVGGRATDLKAIQDTGLIGSMQVAAANQEVLVMIYGIAWSTADAALATIGTKITGGTTTAGRVGSLSAAAGNFVGVTLSAQGTIGSPILIGVGFAH